LSELRRHIRDYITTVSLDYSNTCFRRPRCRLLQASYGTIRVTSRMQKKNLRRFFSLELLYCTIQLEHCTSSSPPSRPFTYITNSLALDYSRRKSPSNHRPLALLAIPETQDDKIILNPCCLGAGPGGGGRVGVARACPCLSPCGFLLLTAWLASLGLVFTDEIRLLVLYHVKNREYNPHL
jgi:hypothetical protein